MESISSSVAPSITCFKGNIYLAWVSCDNKINIISSRDGKDFSFRNEVTLFNESTNIAPHLSVVNGMLCLTWKETDNYLNTRYSFDGVTWSDQYKSTLNHKIQSDKIAVCDGNF